MIERAKWVVHNLVAHPLLVLWPRAGEWLHDHTIPAAERHGSTPPLTITVTREMLDQVMVGSRDLTAVHCAACFAPIPDGHTHYCTKQGTTYG